MLKLHQLDFNQKDFESRWYYLETENSVIFIRFTDSACLYIYLSNKQRLAVALKSASKSKVIELSDPKLEKMVDGFSSNPETPAYLGLLASNPFEAGILETIYTTTYNLSLESMQGNQPR